MKSINPYINFNGNCEEAFTFYQRVFGGELDLVRYKDMKDTMGLEGEALNLIANVALPMGNGALLYGSDTPDTENFGVKAGDQIQINIETESLQEGERLFADLSKDGKTIMPFSKTEWAEGFGMVSDPFGIKWMIMYSGEQ